MMVPNICSLGYQKNKWGLKRGLRHYEGHLLIRNLFQDNLF